MPDLTNTHIQYILISESKCIDIKTLKMCSNTSFSVNVQQDMHIYSAKIMHLVLIIAAPLRTFLVAMQNVGPEYCGEVGDPHFVARHLRKQRGFDRLILIKNRSPSDRELSRARHFRTLKTRCCLLYAESDIYKKMT